MGAMAKKPAPTAAELRAAVSPLGPWLRGETADEALRPDRQSLGHAVRTAVAYLAVIAPGPSVELRVPPFAATQCIAGPMHRRGTPPAVIEVDPRTWLQWVVGELPAGDATAVISSGERREEVFAQLPLVRLT